jgi:hypothetical protein
MNVTAKSVSQVVTANDLRSGAVVYLTVAGDWSRSIFDAAIAPEAMEMGHLEAVARAAVVARRVTAVYAMPVSVVGGRPHPITVRERIRAAIAAT